MRAAAASNVRRSGLFAALSFTPLFVPVVVLFWEDNGLDLFDVFLLQSLFAVAAVLLEVPTGMVADRFGKRASLLFGEAAIVAGFVLYGLGHSFGAFLLAEVVLALGAALISGADTSLLYDSLKELGREDEYTRISGRNSAIQQVGFAAATLLGGFLGTWSLRATLWASMIGPALALVIALGFSEIQRPKRSTTLRGAATDYLTLLGASWRFITKHKLVRWQMALLATLAGSASWLFWLYQPYMEWAGTPLWAFGVVFMLFNLWAAGASRMAHRVNRHLSANGTIATLMILQLLPLPLLAWFVGPWSIFFALAHQTTRGVARPIIHARILRYTYADKRATVLSMSTLSARLFFAATAPMVGFVSERTTMPETLAFMGVVLLIAFAVLIAGWTRIPDKYFDVKEDVAVRQ